jgi:hypothetical protein
MPYPKMSSTSDDLDLTHVATPYELEDPLMTRTEGASCPLAYFVAAK